VCITVPVEGCTDSADWCSKIFAGQCYEHNHDEICCATCSLYETSQPGALICGPTTRSPLFALHSVRQSVSSVPSCKSVKESSKNPNLVASLLIAIATVDAMLRIRAVD